MKKVLSTGVVLLLALVTSLTWSWGQEKEPKQIKPQSSNQALMRDKLVQMNRILEGLTLDDFDRVNDAAETLREISKATSWHIADPTPQYKRLSKNFQEQAEDLKRHASEKNVEAATLDLVRMNITCTHCHQHMREIRSGK